MDWIKRNLYFLVGSLVAVALMGLAGWYLYSKWQLNNDILGGGGAGGTICQAEAAIRTEPPSGFRQD